MVVSGKGDMMSMMSSVGNDYLVGDMVRGERINFSSYYTTHVVSISTLLLDVIG